MILAQAATHLTALALDTKKARPGASAETAIRVAVFRFNTLEVSSSTLFNPMAPGVQ
jgi:hypothetical protein